MKPEYLAFMGRIAPEKAVDQAIVNGETEAVLGAVKILVRDIGHRCRIVGNVLERQGAENVYELLITIDDEELAANAKDAKILTFKFFIIAHVAQYKTGAVALIDATAI